MRTLRCFFLVLLIIQVVGIFEIKGQQYLENYPGIPIISYSWELQWKDYDYQKKKEAGITAITATMVNETIFNKAKDNELKIIPYPGKKSNAGFMVAKYTDAAYTVWEAEGDADSSEYATLSRAGSDTCDTYNDNGTQCIITTANLSGAPNEAVILCGPEYTQQNKYIIRETDALPANVRIYTASFKMKLQKIDTQIPITGFEDSIICKLRVYAKNDLGSEYTIKDTSIKVGDLDLYNWSESVVKYKLDALPLDYYHSYSKPEWAKIINIEGFVDTVKFAERILFEVTWKKVSNLRLLVDKITCYDERGWELKHDEYTQNWLIHQVNNTGDDNTNPNRLKNITSTDFDSTCIGWMALDEPPTIDNYEPVRFIDSIIHISSGGTRRMFVSTCASWNAEYGGNGFAPKDVVILKEMEKRMGFNLNTINYYPFYSCSVSFSNRIAEIDQNFINRNLIKMKEHNPQFMYTVQIGKWIDKNGNGIEEKPTREQFLYLTNIALLCGAKGICIPNYFDLYDGATLVVDGLCSGKDSCEPHDRYFTFKDTLKPRLSGLFGKTLKQANSTKQVINQSIKNRYEVPDSISTHVLQFLKLLNNPTQDSFYVDIGGFHTKETVFNKYFMILNRYYSNMTGLQIGLDSLNNYINWTAFSYTDTSYKCLVAVNDTVSFIDSIGLGDAKLYGIKPAVLYGGEIKANESISGTNTLLGELKIKSGKTLTVSGTYDCYKNLIVESGGHLSISHGTKLNFYNGAKLIVYGSITAIGTHNSMIDFNFQSVAENSQNGIYLNAGSIDTLVYCIIQNGYFGIKVSSSEPFINYCDIKSCTDGIYFYDSHYQPDMDEGTRVYNSNIHSNYSTGINLLESSPLLMGNNITGNYVGIKCLSNSSPFLGKPFDYGFNLVTGEYAALESDASSPVLGDDELMIGGLNSVYNDIGDYDVIASNESYIAAQNCWWGEYEPDKEDFELLDKSELFYDPALEYDPLQSNTPLRIIEPLVYQSDGGTLPEDVKPMSPVENSVNKKYKQALQKYINGQYSEARSLCKSIILSSPDSTISYAALRLLKNMLRDSNARDSLKGFLQSNLQNAQLKEFNVYAKIMLADLSKNDYINTLNGIVSWYPVTVKKPYILFKKFFYYLNEVEDKESALNTFNQMTTAYPTHTLTREAKHLLGQPTILSKGKTTVSVKPVTYELTQNYPNPFNPVTTIKYGIKERTDVRVDVFDILGRKIKTLVNEPKDAGYYEVVFDASKLSSGVYIYRLTTKDFTASRKMMVVK